MTRPCPRTPTTFHSLSSATKKIGKLLGQSHSNKQRTGARKTTQFPGKKLQPWTQLGLRKPSKESQIHSSKLLSGHKLPSQGKCIHCKLSFGAANNTTKRAAASWIQSRQSRLKRREAAADCSRSGCHISNLNEPMTPPLHC